MLKTQEQIYKEILSHQHTVSILEKRYMTNEAGSSYIVNEDMDHLFTRNEVKYFEREWKKGKEISSIAKGMNRDLDEVYLLYLDRKRRKRKRKEFVSGMYVVNEDLDHLFTHDDVRYFEKEWKRGRSIGSIAKKMKRNPDEVFLLYFDRMRKHHKKCVSEWLNASEKTLRYAQ